VASHHDRHEARNLGVSGVPFFTLDGRLAMSGAQEPETFMAFLQRPIDAEAGEAAAAGSTAGREGEDRHQRPASPCAPEAHPDDATLSSGEAGSPSSGGGALSRSSGDCAGLADELWAATY
jgi:hypothetical protein